MLVILEQWQLSLAASFAECRVLRVEFVHVAHVRGFYCCTGASALEISREELLLGADLFSFHTMLVELASASFDVEADIS